MPTPSDSDTIKISLTVNGAAREIEIKPSDRLLDVLRYTLNLPGTKEGCGEGECGACTVYLDGLPVNSCLVLASQAQGLDIRTIESVDDQTLQPMLESGATQCGACTPGVVMCAAWINNNPHLQEKFTLRELMAGNLCRCTGYDGIIEGLQAQLEASGGASPCKS